MKGQQTFDEIRRKYQRDADFRHAVDRYIADFESLLQDASRRDPDNTRSKSYLTSNTGKVLHDACACLRALRLSENRRDMRNENGRSCEAPPISFNEAGRREGSGRLTPNGLNSGCSHAIAGNPCVTENGTTLFTPH